MIIPDVNLLVYAYNELAPQHLEAKAWLEQAMAGSEAIALPWAVIYGFLRIVTHPAVLVEPLPVSAALDRIESWLARDSVEVLDPGPQHLRIARRLFEATSVGGVLSTDTHLAALAIEYQCELHSNDSDFGRFPGLRWRNPLA